MVAANKVSDTVVASGTVGALQTWRFAKEGQAELTVEERRKVLFKKLELSGLKSWLKENKEKALNLLAEYHDIFALEDGEMRYTKAAELKIEVTNLKPFKERPWNIPPGLPKEVMEDLDHMLYVGAIKPSKSAWCNAVVPLPQIHDAIDALSGSKYYTTVDLLSGFWQTPMEESSKQYTAFTIGTLGFFQYKCMPFLFGLPGWCCHLFQYSGRAFGTATGHDGVIPPPWIET